MNFPRGQVFGTWDAPATDDDIPIPTPVGETCIWCQTRVQEGDNGRISPLGQIEHRECSLRGVVGGIGHHVDHERYCHGDLGPDAGLSFRASAMLVWNWWQLTGGGHPSARQRAFYREVLKLVAEGSN